MSGIKLDFQGEAATQHVMGKAMAVLGAAAVRVAVRARELTSIQGPPRSAEHNPPHMDTTQLHSTIFSEVNISEMKASVGSTAPQALYTELGTSKMAPRPWLRRAIAEASAEIGGWRDENDLPREAGSASGGGFFRRAAKRVARFFGLGKK